MKKVNNLFNAGYGWGRTYPLRTRLKTRLREESIDYSKEYMYVEALEDGMVVQLSLNAVDYSLDGSTWNTLTAATNTPVVNAGEKIYFKGNLTPANSKTASGVGKFTISKKCNIGGNIMSLLFGDNFIGKTDLTGKDYAFYGLFKNCTTIQSAENLILSATTLAERCYSYMFERCTSLTTPPLLPATTLASRCYESMFSGCTSLTSTPELPATTLAKICYAYMFYNCTSLTSAPALPATTLAESCYSNMFQNCTSLTSAPALPATTLANNCYYNMFYGCTSLTTAPVLPATTLTSYCYCSMFDNCTSLNYIKMLATDISAYDCLSGWVYNVSATGTFVKADGVEIPSGTSGIPEGWTVETASA